MTAIHLKIEQDIIDKPVKLDILNDIPPQVNEIPQHFIHEIKTIAYDVIGVNVFLRTLMRILRKKVETVESPESSEHTLFEISSRKTQNICFACTLTE